MTAPGRLQPARRHQGAQVVVQLPGGAERWVLGQVGRGADSVEYLLQQAQPDRMGQRVQDRGSLSPVLIQEPAGVNAPLPGDLALCGVTVPPKTTAPSGCRERICSTSQNGSSSSAGAADVVGDLRAATAASRAATRASRSITSIARSYVLTIKSRAGPPDLPRQTGAYPMKFHAVGVGFARTVQNRHEASRPELVEGQVDRAERVTRRSSRRQPWRPARSP